MGDEQRGLAGLLQRLRQVALQHHAGLRVDRRERLVEQQHVRIDRERARQRHALAHAAGQLVRIVAGEFGEVEIRRAAVCARRRRSAAGTPWISTPNMTFSATVRHGSSRSFCSMKATCAFGPCDALAVDEGRAFARRRQAGADIEERAFAAAARPDQRDHFAIAHREADVAHGGEHAAAAGFAQSASSRCGIRGGRREQWIDRAWADRPPKLSVWADCVHIAAQICQV